MSLGKKTETDYCIECKSPMAEIELGGKVKRCFVCVEKDCKRFGLMAVVGYKLVKKMDRKEVENGKLPPKSPEKSKRPKD